MIKNFKLQYLGFLLVAIFSFNNTMGQNYPVFELDQFLTSSNKNVYKVALGKSGKSATPQEAEKIKKLIYDLNPMLFISDTGIKTFGKGAPVVAVMETLNYEILETPNPLFNSVELIKIKLWEVDTLNKKLDVSNLREFTNLKYVFVECSFQCSITSIKKMFSNVEGLTILYHISSPE